MNFNFIFLFAVSAASLPPPTSSTSIDSQWIGVENSRPPCFYKDTALRCGEQELSFSENLIQKPTAFDNVTILAILEDRLAPELEKLKGVTPTPRKIFYSLADLKLPDTFALPINESAQRVFWSSPFLIFESQTKVLWREAHQNTLSSATEWRSQFGRFLDLAGTDGFLIVTPTGEIQKIDLKSSRPQWTVKLPIEFVSQEITRGRKLRHLLEVQVQKKKSLWLDPLLGAWIHLTDDLSRQAEKTASVCPEVSKSFPQYRGWKVGDSSMCFSYFTQKWSQESTQAPHDIAEFWKEWIPSLVNAHGVLVEKLPHESEKLKISAYLSSTQDQKRLHWYIDQLCSIPQCGHTLQFRLLPLK